MQLVHVKGSVYGRAVEGGLLQLYASGLVYDSK